MPEAEMQANAGDENRRRSRDPEQTRRDILDAAIAEFSEHGLSGARVDAIAARTRTTVRMIYYYFGSKEGLYRTVLEQSYGAMRKAEAGLALHGLAPADAIRRLVEFVFDYQEAHPEFTRLVSIENIHRARHLAVSETIQKQNATVMEALAAILERGQEQGVFRKDAAPLGLHMLMTAFCFFRVSNRYTLGTIFRDDPLSPALRAAHKEMAVASVLGYLQAGATAPAPHQGRQPQGARRKA
ncbi:TetR family transcriptional regulator [Rhodovastum sp. RN2-1]|uniref:TetR family transcriptional regulator n=1 Tax=Limobrevibacterium gyesilva TaxID=2991712 RepID=A0AA42CJI4_9PROT|nr:TetR family transcriptional regulator [Limobrevibacterium gyesilva]